MKLLTTLIALALCTTLSAQQRVDSRQIDPFTAISLSGKLTVELIPSDTTGVEIILHDTDIKNLVWGVSDSLLSIRLRPARSANASAEVKLYYTTCTNLTASEANITISGAIEEGMLDLSLQNGAILSGEIQTEDLLLNTSANALTTLSGSAKYLTLEAGGKSKVDTRELFCQSALIHAQGGAECYIFSNERLEILSESGASVYYRGEPTILRLLTRMMGTANSIGE